MPSPLLLLLVLLLLGGSAFAVSPQSLFLPLKTQQLHAPPPASRLHFRHNVSLLVTLSVGSPPQAVSMVLDTGSELSWLLCPSPTFRPALSATYRPVPCASAVCASRARALPSPAFCNASVCRVSASYADGSSADGDLAVDTFRVGQSPPLRLAFGCMASAYSSSVASAGLLGMNRGPLSLVSQMGTRRFSYCIAAGEGSDGVLLLGDAALPFELALNYTPFVRMPLPLPYFDRVAYSVRLQGIRVGDNLLPIPKSVLEPDHTGAGQTMVDSGTQFTFLLGPAYSALRAEFLRQTTGVLTPDPDFIFQSAFDLCFRLPAGSVAPPALPAVTMLFEGAEMTVSGSRLLYKAPGVRVAGDEIWCLTFGNSDLVPVEAYVIGHYHQQELWVEYDLEGGRVGFAPMQCETASRKLAMGT